MAIFRVDSGSKVSAGSRYFFDERKNRSVCRVPNGSENISQKLAITNRTLQLVLAQQDDNKVRLVNRKELGKRVAGSGTDHGVQPSAIETPSVDAGLEILVIDDRSSLYGYGMPMLFQV